MKKYLLITLSLAMLIGFVVPVQASDKSIVKIGSDVRVEEDMRIEDAVAIGGSVYVDGVVDGDAVAIGGTIYLGDSAVVHGDAVTVGGRIEEAEGAMIYGSTVDVSSINIDSFFDNMDFSHDFRGFPRAFKFISVIGLFALVILLSLIMPKELNKISTVVKNEPLQMFLYGLLGVILIIPIALMLVISVIGIALIPLEILAVFLASLIGYIAVAVLIGERILNALNNDDPNVIISAILGVLLLWLIGLIPFVGGLVKVIVCIIGFGAVIIAVARRNRKTEELVIEEVAEEK